MKYVFLTNSIGGINGGVCYIRNKLVFLHAKGWDVEVFDSTGQTYEEVQLVELMPYSNNRIPELFYNPNSFSIKQKQKVIKSIKQSIGEAEKIVIESNMVNLALWGEEIACQIKAKHLVYLIQEKLEIRNESEYLYLKYKRDRNELFSINAMAYNKLFKKFENNDDGYNHHWGAGNDSVIADVSCAELDGCIKADYNIGHFGRVKDYFPSMFNEIAKFANSHMGKKINFILLGIESLDDSLKRLLPDNVHVRVIKSQQPVPRSFFDLSDVVIATAGCASMSYKHGSKVISMEVESGMPLGVMGYDTIDRAFRSPNNVFHDTLSVLLDRIFDGKRYEGAPTLDYPKSKHDYGFQVSCIEPKDEHYYDISKVRPSKSFSAIITDIMLRLGMVKLRSKIRHRTMRNNRLR